MLCDPCVEVLQPKALDGADEDDREIAADVSPEAVDADAEVLGGFGEREQRGRHDDVLFNACRTFRRANLGSAAHDSQR